MCEKNGFSLQKKKNVYSELTIVGLIAIPVFWFPWDEDQERKKKQIERANVFVFVILILSEQHKMNVFRT